MTKMQSDHKQNTQQQTKDSQQLLKVIDAKKQQKNTNKC